MSVETWEEMMRYQVVQFTEKHKWRGTLGYVVEVKKCGDDFKCMIACTCPSNQGGCDTAYIYSMASKKEFEPLLDGHVVLAPAGGEE